MVKSWGWWTQHKLNILGTYLQLFATASTKASERIYLDLFAGSPENVSRETNKGILGSTYRALTAHPPFTRICLFELPSKARRMEENLRRRYPNRRGIKVYSGDCNEKIDEALNDLARAGLRWAPTFAFIDQYDHEVHWETLAKIAAFKEAGRPKAEMWILFGTSFYARGLRLRQKALDPSYADDLTRMFGSEEWLPITEGRRRGLLDARQWRREIVNLMRWRLQQVLGYKESHALTIRNTRGHNLYDMIFVTDHPAGDRIMQSLCLKSPAQQEAMRQHARALLQDKDRSARGEDPLIGVEPEFFTPLEGGYEQAFICTPPHEPYQLPR